MRKTLVASLIVGGLVVGGVVPTAQAAWPVIDVAAIAQLVTQVRTLQSQLQTAQTHLLQAQNAYRAITGGRGMDQLLAGQVRNYLPADWQQLADVVANASQSYGALAASLDAQANANAVLNNAALGALPPGLQAEVLQARRSAALLQTLTRSALQTTSARFQSLQGLINAIPGAADEKGVLDLQARIGAEQAMLENEQSKLNALFATAQAEREAQVAQRREVALRDVGSLRALPAMGL